MSPVKSALFCAALVSALAAPALADPPCGVVEVRFSPGAKHLQIVVWIEDGNGNVLATPYITRSIGQFGLGNRPGSALLKTDFRWPYGRRDMVFPIWAHRRNHHYPKIVMGGICGNSPTSLCPDGSQCAGDCVDTTIAYHPRVSSYEPFYCSPSGGLPRGMDAVSCASTGTFSKGAYDPSSYSLYPPRADLTNFTANDSPDARDFAKENDLVAVSAATPAAGTPLSPPVDWFPQSLPTGDYVAFIELSQESDFNTFNNHPNQDDSVSSWNFEGHPFLGQPSVVYRIPFHYDATFGYEGSTAIATQYDGYSSWDGSDGVIHPPDGTITDMPGTGAGRLLDVNDGVDVYRAKVVVGSCTTRPSDGGMSSDGGSCDAPDPVTDLALSGGQTSITLTFRAPAGGTPPTRFVVRYREGDTPITGSMFDSQVAGPELAATQPGASLSADLTGLKATTDYAVAVRAVSACGRGSAVVSEVSSTTVQQFVTLHGCFIATAAYGSKMEADVRALRRFRDRHLLGNPLGQLFTATYYALSPPVARAISTDEHLRALARAALRPLVQFITR